MPAIAAAIGWVLLQVAGSFAVQMLVGLGVGVLTFSGMDVTLGWLKTQALASFSALDPTIVGLLAYMKVGVAMNIIFSALVMRLTLAGVQSGTFKKWVHK
ncbi:DUF2523 domain-containing protein [Xylophilus rhododendri]|uniref:DUF2523 domain-containing protein n=1 Tax=Xylophilus rhododendri TaxID=2697032 RepID=A0A857J0Y7_9BURK|nr:DUF2523 domain-containing protein [Xylophilus rhododendri]QHI96751.1 DUF2523 domain-containing protein [Xylophilus rhododendri]